MSKRGGKRKGAGRPKLIETKVVRLPVACVTEIKRLSAATRVSLPVYTSKVQAGFPSPADDYIEEDLDLNTKFIKNPASTFIVKASGDSMIDAGIFHNDWLIVDRSINAKDNDIVIAAVNGHLTVKRLSCKANKLQLIAANINYKPIDITEGHDMIIWGIVTLVLHQPK